MDTQELLKSIRLTKLSSLERGFIPSLSYICFTGTGMVTFNGAQAVRRNFPTEFSGCVNGELLFKAVSSFQNKELNVSKKNQDLIIKSGKSTVKLAMLETNQFLFQENFDTEKDGEFVVDLEQDFLKGLKLCLLSVSDNPFVPNHDGITLHNLESCSFLYSTKNTTASSYSSKSFSDKDFKILLPKKFCEILLKVVDNRTDGKLHICGDYVVAYVGEDMVYTKVRSDITFVDYESVFDNILSKDVNFTQAPEEFIPVIDRSISCNIGGSDISTEVSFTGASVDFNTVTQFCQVHDNIDLKTVDTLKGKSCKFDPKLIKECSPFVDSISFTTFQNQIVFIGCKENNFLHLVINKN